MNRRMGQIDYEKRGRACHGCREHYLMLKIMKVLMFKILYINVDNNDCTYSFLSSYERFDRNRDTVTEISELKRKINESFQNIKHLCNSLYVTDSTTEECIKR